MPTYRVTICEEVEYEDEFEAESPDEVRECVENGDFSLDQCDILERYITRIIEVKEDSSEVKEE